MKPSRPIPVSAPRRNNLLPRIFAGAFGAFLGLSLLKFANPPIMEKWVSAPNGWLEFVLNSAWPISWAFCLLLPVSLLGLFVARRNPAAPRWLVALPLVWLLWEALAAANSIDAALSRATLKHFVACVICFYLGLFSLNHPRRLRLFWPGVMAGIFLVLAAGWQQHFGGLAETRRYFFQYIYPTMTELPPGYIKKISSNRIFSTLFYPNALAGGILLLLPAMLVLVWQSRGLFTVGARRFLVAAISMAALACLYWSGSKGGWLLMLLLGLIALLQLPLSKKIKAALVAAVLLAGLAGFFLKYAGFFERGATSVSARFDYWQAALRIVKEHPLFGTGPGTFSIPYQKIKRPESEPARLVHNDYLEQAADSGLLGMAAYTLFIVAALAWSYREVQPSQNPNLNRNLSPPPRPDSAKMPRNWLPFAVWLGLLGWSLQEFFEFGLYIPALAWPAFTFFGWLLGRKADGN